MNTKKCERVRITVYFNFAHTPPKLYLKQKNMCQTQKLKKNSNSKIELSKIYIYVSLTVKKKQNNYNKSIRIKNYCIDYKRKRGGIK